MQSLNQNNATLKFARLPLTAYGPPRLLFSTLQKRTWSFTFLCLAKSVPTSYEPEELPCFLGLVSLNMIKV